MVNVLEWWPDYGGQLLHVRTGRGGTPVELDRLPLSTSTVQALRRWVSSYADERLPIEGSGDSDWVDEGVDLLRRCREELQPDYEVVVTEPWWGDPPTE